MNHRSRFVWFFISGVALLAAVSTIPAWAADCGDTTGPGGSDVPCSCGDVVTSDTVLDASDPVTDGVCSPVGLYVSAGAKLDAHALNMRCADSPSFPNPITIGLFLFGGLPVSVDRGIVRGCDYGVFAVTDRSRIERVTARDGRLGLFIIGDDNQLSGNLCQGSTFFGGIFLVGDGNTLDRNYCHGNPTGDGIALVGHHNILRQNLCHQSVNGINVQGDDNTLDRNYCRGNTGEGIFVHGSFNQLHRNQGHSNGAHGVLLTGGDNLTDGCNYASGNGVTPQCSIDGQSATADGRYC